jgi:hypothetical protein
MSEETVQEQKIEQETGNPVIPAGVVEVPPAPEKDFIYEYQPLDDHGRALGAKQVFRGKDAQEVLDKVAKAHQESIKLTRELKRKNRLGLLDGDEIPDTVVRMGQPAEGEESLTVEQRLEKVESTSIALQAKSEAELFRQMNPSYYPCQENFETITNWMVKYNLAPVCDNFQFAFNKLSEVGLLLSAPIVREEPVSEVKPEETIPVNTNLETVVDSRITETTQSQQNRVVKPASGLTRDIASNGTPVLSNNKAADQISYTVPAIVETDRKTGIARVMREAKTYTGKTALDKMPADEYKRRLYQDPGFKKAVDALDAQASQQEQ